MVDSGAPGRPLVPAEGPKLPPVSNDINSLAAAHSCCLGPFWWPLWWPQTNRVPWKKNDTPVAFGNLWLSKRGTKGAVVAVVLSAELLVLA